jgi:hypothetical protein
MAQLITEMSLTIDSGGRSQSVAVSTTSAQSAAISAPNVVLTPTVSGFIRQGANPTAVSDGTDIFLLGNNTYRLGGFVPGNKLAFIAASGTGTLYITPEG